MSNNYFFVSPSYITGMARILDLGATFDAGSYLIGSTPAEADARARTVDWNAIQNDLTAAGEANEQEESVAEEAA